jgi:hypothetical protein
MIKTETSYTMTGLAENIGYENSTDGLPSFPMSVPGSAHTVPPPLMPFNIFPDPAADMLNRMKSAASESCACESDAHVPDSHGYKVADIFRLYWKDYQAGSPVTERQSKAVYDILNCRTGAFGYSISACDNCGHTETFPNSCRNSHCPECQGLNRNEWVNARLDDLLPVPYHHAVFTLPDKIFPFCLYNQKTVYDLLFASAAETLKEFGYDTKWLGGKTGFFMVLHTWGQLLTAHPHVHCVIPAGAYNEEISEWVHPVYEKNCFLFPVRALSKVFRGKFIHGLKAVFDKGALEFPGELAPLECKGRFEAYLDNLVSTDWVVYSKAPFSGAEAAVRYVGRYTFRVAVSSARIVTIDNGVIRFKFKNYKKLKDALNYKDIWEVAELPADVFIRRFLYHILPKSYHRIRHYGFLGGGSKALRQEIWEYLVFEEEAGVLEIKTESYAGTPCPECENGVLLPIVVIDGSGRIIQGGFSELAAFRAVKRDTFEAEKTAWDTS